MYALITKTDTQIDKQINIQTESIKTDKQTEKIWIQRLILVSCIEEF